MFQTEIWLVARRSKDQNHSMGLNQDAYITDIAARLSLNTTAVHVPAATLTKAIPKYALFPSRYQCGIVSCTSEPQHYFM